MAGTNLGKAYVQIVPSTEGMKGALESALNKEVGGVGDKLGGDVGGGILGGIAGILNGKGKSVLEGGLSSLLTEAGLSSAAAGPLAGIAVAAGGALIEAGKTAAKVTAQVVKGVAEGGAAVAGLGISGAAALGKSAVENYATFEQVSDGARKIFDELDYSAIEKDAFNAFKELNLGANDYLESINITGATFAQTMGDKKGYETARRGMKAVSDFSAGTGKDIALLNEKYQMISRSASVYQSIADQFAGILPQTSADFLEQAQAAGLLSSEYKKLTAVPVAEYQEAVTEMLARGVDELGFTGKTAQESLDTITGSLNMTKAAWNNLLVGLADPDVDLKQQTDNLLESILGAFNEDGERQGGLVKNIVPRFKEAVSQIGPALKELSHELSGTLTELLRDEELTDALLDGAGSLIDGALDALPGVLDAALDRAPKLIGRFSEWLEKKLPVVTEKVLSGLAEHSEELAEAGSGLLDAIFSGLELSSESVAKYAEPIITPFITEIMTKLPEWVSSAMKSAGNIGGAIVKAVWDGIKDGIDNLMPDKTGGYAPTDAEDTGVGIYEKKGWADYGQSFLDYFVGASDVQKQLIETGEAVWNTEDGLVTITQDQVDKATGSFSCLKGVLEKLTPAEEGTTEAAYGLAGGTDAAASGVSVLNDKAAPTADTVTVLTGSVTGAADSAGSLAGSAGAAATETDAAGGAAAAAAPAVDGLSGSAAAAGETLTQAAAGAQTFSAAVSSLDGTAFGAGFDFMSGFAQGLEGGGYLTEAAVAATKSTVEQLSSLSGAAGGWGTEISFNFAIGIRAGQGMVTTAIDGLEGECEALADIDAVSWGLDLADSFAQGIARGADRVTSAVAGLADIVHSLIGFSEPEEGPLSDFHTYAPDMMELFAKGVKDNEAVVREQIRRSFDFGEYMDQTGTVNAEGGGESDLERVLALLAVIAENTTKGRGGSWDDLLDAIDRGLGRKAAARMR